MFFFPIISSAFFFVASATSNLRVEFKHGVKVRQTCQEAASVVYPDLTKAVVAQNIRECFKAKHDLVQKIFKDAANKDAVDDTEFLYQVYLFTHQLDDWRLGGKAKTLPEIYKGFISKKTGKQVTIPKNAKDGIKPANDAAAPTKTQRDNLKIAYNYVRTRVGTNLEKILKTADACTNKVAYICVDATEHAYPEDMGGASSTSNKKSKILHKTATVSEGVNDDTKVYSMKDVQDLLYNSTDLPLAKSGTDHLPVIVLAAGFKAIDELASAVLSTFKNNGRGVKLQGAETAWLQDFIGLPKTVRDSLEWDEFSDVAAFVSEVVRCVKLNTILVGAAAVWQSRRGSDHTIQLTVEEREELRVSVFWCFLLHAVTKKVTFQPRGSENCLLQQLVTAFDNKRKEIEWEKEKCFSKFFKMKVWGVERLIKDKGTLLDLKLGKEQLDPKAGGGGAWRLSVNILMAMYTDVRNGFDANAEAGFELMVETNDQNPIKGLGNKLDCEFVHDGVNLGIALMTPPLPTVWANLYSSWNLAFVSGGLSPRPIPMIAAKLLAPVVLRTYQEVDPGLYLAPRVIGLYIALQYNVLAQPSHYQVLMADGKLRNHSDWRIKMKESANLLGEVSQVAGRQFHARIDKIVEDNYGVGFEIFKDVSRAGMKVVWAALRGMIKTFSYLD